jgi:hypothetical protein
VGLRSFEVKLVFFVGKFNGLLFIGEEHLVEINIEFGRGLLQVGQFHFFGPVVLVCH